MTNSNVGSANLNQRLSLDSSEVAFIGAFKSSLEKDFGRFKMAVFGRVEFISSAPDVAYNDLDTTAIGVFQGPDDETRLDDHFAYSFSVGVRLTVPFDLGQ